MSVNEPSADLPDPAGSPGEAPGRLAGWLAARRRRILLVLLGMALLLRLGAFLELNTGPCLVMDRFPLTDMHFFRQWSRAVSSGDWLTDRALHPYHEWHRRIAAEYFRRYPAEREAYAGREPSAERALWNDWYGGKGFHQEPLYPYLLALTTVLTGDDIRWVFLWQSLLGLLSVGLIFGITRRLWGDMAALVAGLLAVGYGPFLFSEFTLLRTSLINFAGLCLVWLLLINEHRTAPVRWLVIGLALGAALLLKSIFLLLALGALGMILLRRPRWSRPAWRAAAALLLGMAVPVGGVVARNLAVGAPAGQLSAVNTITFVEANVAGHRPGRGFTFSVEHTPVIMHRSNGRFLPAVAETLATHDGVISYLRLMAGKWLVLWNGFEYPNNCNFYYYRMHSRVLSWLPVTFGLLAPLAFAGMFLGLRTGRGRYWLYLLAGMHLLSMMATYVIARFRIPLAAALIPFAALALIRLVQWLTQRRFGPAAALVVAVVLLGWGMNRPVNQPRVRPGDHLAAYNVYTIPRYEAARRQGDWAACARILAASLEGVPAYHDLAAGDVRRLADDERRLAGLLVQVYGLYAEALYHLGEADRAFLWRERAEALRRRLDGGQAPGSIPLPANGS
jgi:hypothetical protein